MSDEAFQNFYQWLLLFSIILGFCGVANGIFMSWLHWRLRAELTTTKEEIKAWINGTYSKKPTNADDIAITRREFHYASEGLREAGEGIKELIRAIQANIAADHARLGILEKSAGKADLLITELHSQLDELKSEVHRRRHNDRN